MGAALREAKTLKEKWAKLMENVGGMRVRSEANVALLSHGTRTVHPNHAG